MTGGERGGVGLLTALLVSMLLIAGVAVVGVVMDLQGAAARARTAADAGALAAAGASPLNGGGSDPCGAARRVVRANGGALEHCERKGSPEAFFAPDSGFVVDASVRPAHPLVRAVAGEVTARAASSLRPAGLELP